MRTIIICLYKIGLLCTGYFFFPIFPASHDAGNGLKDPTAPISTYPWEKKLATVTAHRELTYSSRWPKWSQPAVTEPWPGPWLSCDLAVTEPRSYWRCSQPAVTSPWLSCDLAVTELWPSRDWAVTSPWLSLAVTEPWSLGPGAVTTVVTVSSPWALRELTSPWAHRELTETIHFLMGSGGPVTPTPIREYNGLRGENRGSFKGQQASASNSVMADFFFMVPDTDVISCDSSFFTL